MWSVILAGLVKAIEADPSLVEKLIAEAIMAGTKALAAHNAALAK